MNTNLNSEKNLKTRQDLKTTFTALVTPFLKQDIDFDSLDSLVQFQMKNGIQGFVVNGTTAESPTLSSSEVKDIYLHLRRKFPELLLVMGTGSNSTASTIEACRNAEELGADGCLVVVPYYNKPPQRGLFAHFKTIAESLKQTPMILYNVPGRTITALELPTIEGLSKVPGIFGIKEASGSHEFARQISSHCGDDFVLLSGDDGTYVEFLENGGHGIISVATHVLPQQFVEIKQLIAQKKNKEAKAIIEKYKNLIDLLFCEANPIPVKKALQLKGIIRSAECRLPLVELSPAWTEKLSLEMSRVGVL